MNTYELLRLVLATSFRDHVFITNIFDYNFLLRGGDDLLDRYWILLPVSKTITTAIMVRFSAR